MTNTIKPTSKISRYHRHRKTKPQCETFVTCTITRGLANIGALRDWGHAKDSVRMQWMMQQQDKPEDFVIATGVQYSVRDFINNTAATLGITPSWSGAGVDEVATWVQGNNGKGKAVVKIDTSYYQPTEVETLLGSPTKVKEKLGWVPEITLDEMITQMVASDLQATKQKVPLQSHSYQEAVSAE